MTRLYIRTPSRLHFGLFSWGEQAPRQFGGIGLMIDRPGVELTAEPAPNWGAEGPLADRTLQVARQVAERLALEGTIPKPVHFWIHRAPAEHVGLGTGTQLSLAVARAVAALSGRSDLPAATLALLTGRGLRSGIGLHGFDQGGLIVDGGRRGPDGVPPLIIRHPFPTGWSVLVVLPRPETGLHGPREVEAFSQLPPVPDAVTDRLCRLVLLGLLPAIVERDLAAFGAALTAIQFHVGRLFAPVQGGPYAHPDAEAIVDFLRSQGLHGVGQSSWGPALYAFSQAPADERLRLVRRLLDRFRLDPEAIFWTEASSRGAISKTESSES
ncbi:MAG: beta-RFAP synthase [Isosphaeraceae bacterium]|nr:beta-RFAP synthase [Isosphaeraceae bacterium]